MAEMRAFTFFVLRVDFQARNEVFGHLHRTSTEDIKETKTSRKAL